jgi:sterol desaturase/sphingolipid hydroxylase (fatty acid hydroxylase superfamily)
MTDALLRARPFLLFVPWLAAVLTWIALGDFVSWTKGVVLVVSGLLGWSLVEWVFHWAMHVRVGPAVLARFQDQAHLQHHREPHDVEHSVVSLRGSIPLSLLFFGMSWLIFWELPSALLFHTGLLLGYLAYEFVHLATHAKWRIPGLAGLIRYHNRHHFEGWERTFGVTSPLWDWVFGTLPSRSRKRR